MDFVGRNSIADPGGIVEALLAAIHVTPVSQFLSFKYESTFEEAAEQDREEKQHEVQKVVSAVWSQTLQD